MKDENTTLKLENLKLKSELYKHYTNIKTLSLLSVLEFVVIICLFLYG